MGLSLLTPPTAQPVSLDEAKAHLKITDNSQDDQVAGMIVDATQHIESRLQLSLMTRTWRLTLDAFTDAIELPRGPVRSVSTVRYVDADGVTQIIDPADYTADLTSESQWVVRNSSTTWPTPLAAINVVLIDYVAGFDELPVHYRPVKRAILLKVQQFEARHSEPQIVRAIDAAIDDLIHPFRVMVA